MRMRFLVLFVVAVFVLAGGAYFDVPYLGTPGSLVATSIFGVGVSQNEVRSRYARAPLPILIVPGHTNDSWGTEFQGLKEADLNLTLGYHLFNTFKEDSRFAPIIVRSPDGEYARWFENYVDTKREDIEAFRTQAKIKTAYFMGQGLYDSNQNIDHNPAADNVSLELYAVNKLANDYDIPIVLHLHFNDYPRKRSWTRGEYTGFAIYTPEGQLPNASASRSLAEALSLRLGAVVGPSNLPLEKETIIPDQELIAVGSNGSRDGASVVLEYSYIYEPQLHDSSVRQSILKELAYQTYAGVKSFVDPNFAQRREIKETTFLPHTFERPLQSGMRGTEVLALQAALRAEGLYPPSGFSLTNCPLSGYYGSCTSSSVKAFERKYGLPQDGKVAGSVLIKLNEKYAR